MNNNECQLGCGAFVGLGLRDVLVGMFELLLQAAAGGDNPPTEFLELARPFGQKEFNL